MPKPAEFMYVLVTNMSLAKHLHELGLSEKETQVYLALLSAGIITAGQLSKACNINRSTLYPVLESLEQQRLVVAKKEVNEVTTYKAVSVETIVRMADKALNTSIEGEKVITTILPKLNSLYKGTKKKPHVQIFEGKEGVTNALKDALEHPSRSTVRMYSSVHKLFQTLPHFLPSFTAQRIKRGISVKGIYSASYEAHALAETPGDSIEIIPKEHAPSSDIVIYDDKVNLTSHDDLVSIQVKSQDIADVLERIFDLAFEGSKTLQQHPGHKQIEH